MGGSEVEQAVARMRALSDRARALVVGLTEEELNWKPAPDRWSMGECFLHLNVTNRRYVRALETAVEQARAKGGDPAGPFRYGWFEEWFVRQVSPPVKRRFKAPKLFSPPPAARATESDLREFFSVQDRLADVMASAEGVDLTAAKVESPFSSLIRFRLGATIRIVIGHADRHIVQAEGVRESALKERP